MMSMDDYNEIEELKLKNLQDRDLKAKNIHNTVEGDSFFQELLSGQHD